MEKNIKKRVYWLALVLSAVLVVLFGYWFFLNPHGYWQKQKEAEKNDGKAKALAEVGENDHATDVVGHDGNG